MEIFIHIKPGKANTKTLMEASCLAKWLWIFISHQFCEGIYIIYLGPVLSLHMYLSRTVLNCICILWACLEMHNCLPLKGATYFHDTTWRQICTVLRQIDNFCYTLGYMNGIKKMCCMFPDSICQTFDKNQAYFAKVARIQFQSIRYSNPFS